MKCTSCNKTLKKEPKYGVCYSCSRSIYYKNYFNKNKDEILEYNRNYYHSNKQGKVRECRLAWQRKNREVTREHSKNHYYNNKTQYRAKTAKYRSEKISRTAPWADLVKIKEIYSKCPPGYEVDHIIPLQGKEVSGLHVEYNLQYLPKAENRSKGNKYS